MTSHFSETEKMRTRERPRARVEFPEKSMAKQSFKDECDINTIMAKHMATGLVDHVGKYQGRYMDLPDENGYHENINRLMAAEAAFQSLPSQIRSKFDNDPGKFLGWVQNPENQDEINALGLGLKASEAAPEVAIAPAPKKAPEKTAE